MTYGSILNMFELVKVKFVQRRRHRDRYLSRYYFCDLCHNRYWVGPRRGEWVWTKVKSVGMGWVIICRRCGDNAFSRGGAKITRSGKIY